MGNGAPNVRQPSDTFPTLRDCPDCPEMTIVPGGLFIMGSPSTEIGRQDWREGKQREVRIGYAFAVSRFEVTVDQYSRFLASTGHDGGSVCSAWVDGHVRENTSWRSPGFPPNGANPVTCVSWTDAGAYAAWLSKVTGNRYRLLSEAEWEYVTRAGTTTRRYWGEDGSDADTCRYANTAAAETSFRWKETACGDGAETISTVGRYEPNQFGLYDTLGNVAEWVSDCWNEGYDGAPSDGSAWETGKCEYRVMRGGSWFSNSSSLRAASRNFARFTGPMNTVGFRVARDL